MGYESHYEIYNIYILSGAHEKITVVFSWAPDIIYMYNCNIIPHLQIY